MKYILEEIENGIARLEKEDGTITDVNLSDLPENVKCGDVLVCDNGKYTVSPRETDERRQKLLSLQQRLFKKK